MTILSPIQGGPADKIHPSFSDTELDTLWLKIWEEVTIVQDATLLLKSLEGKNRRVSYTGNCGRLLGFGTWVLYQLWSEGSQTSKLEETAGRAKHLISCWKKHAFQSIHAFTRSEPQCASFCLCAETRSFCGTSKLRLSEIVAQEFKNSFWNWIVPKGADCILSGLRFLHHTWGSGKIFTPHWFNFKIPQKSFWMIFISHFEKIAPFSLWFLAISTCWVCRHCYCWQGQIPSPSLSKLECLEMVLHWKHLANICEALCNNLNRHLMGSSLVCLGCILLSLKPSSSAGIQRTHFW